MPRLLFAMLCALLLPAVGLGQDHVTATATDSVLPGLHGDRPPPDRDLAIAFRLFNGQSALNSRDRSLGVVERVLPLSLRPRVGASTVIAEGVVLRTDAFLAPDLNGMITVLTVLPSAMLAMPGNYPAAAQAGPASRRRAPASAAAPRPAGTTLRFALAGGTIYFDDNNGADVRQAGVRYPAPGEALIFFGETIAADDSARTPSSVLLLTGACAPQGQQCSSIDGNPLTSDALTTAVPNGLRTAAAFSLAGAPIADAESEGVRGLGASVEARYNLGIGDLRALDGPEIFMPPFAAATADELLVRGHILQNEADLTVGGLGVVTVSTVAVDRTLVGTGPKERTMSVTQRGGLLWKDSSVILPALFPAQYPLAEGGDYFLAMGHTSDNRWELRSAWRVVGDRIFSLDRPRTQLFLRNDNAYSMSVDAFLRKLGLH
jgi:hypothetical protein